MKKNDKIFIARHKGLVGSAIFKELKQQGFNNIITKTREELDLLNQSKVQVFFKAEKPEDYHTASDLTKVIMLIGLLYAFVFYYLMAKQFGFSIFNLFIIR